MNLKRFSKRALVIAVVITLLSMLLGTVLIMFGPIVGTPPGLAFDTLASVASCAIMVTIVMFVIQLFYWISGRLKTSEGESN